MRAIPESVISYLLYRVRNGDALKRFAATKSFISYVCYRGRNSDALKIFATIGMAKIHIKSEKLTPFGGIFLGHGAI